MSVQLDAPAVRPRGQRYNGISFSKIGYDRQTGLTRLSESVSPQGGLGGEGRLEFRSRCFEAEHANSMNKPWRGPESREIDEAM
jgi:hypothetical protein